MLYDPLGELLAKKPNVINVKCAAPNCRSSVRTTPNELFFFVPFEQKSRIQWLKNLKLDLFPRLFEEYLSDHNNLFSCQYHFLVDHDKPKPSECLNFRDTYNPVYRNEWNRKRKATIINNSYHLMDLNLENKQSDSESCLLGEKNLKKSKYTYSHACNPLPDSQSANGPKATSQNFITNEEKFSFNDESSSIAIKEENQLTCDYCFEEFLDINALQLHVREYHLDIEPETFQCNKCSVAFVDEAKMLEHLENTHNSLDNAGKSHILEDSLPRNEDIIKKEFNYCSSLYNIQLIQDDSLYFKPKLLECYQCSRTYLYEEDISAHVLVTQHCRYKPPTISSIKAKEWIAKKLSLPISTFLITKEPGSSSTILSEPSVIQNTSHPTCIELKDPSILRTILEKSSSPPTLVTDALCTNNEPDSKHLLNNKPPTLVTDALCTNNEPDSKHILVTNKPPTLLNDKLCTNNEPNSKHLLNNKPPTLPNDKLCTNNEPNSKHLLNNKPPTLLNDKLCTNNEPNSKHLLNNKPPTLLNYTLCTNNEPDSEHFLLNNQYIAHNLRLTLGNENIYEHISRTETDNIKSVDRPCSPHDNIEEINKMSQKECNNFMSVFENFLGAQNGNMVNKAKEVINSKLLIYCKTCFNYFSNEDDAILHAEYCVDKVERARMGIYLISSEVGQTKVNNKKNVKKRKHKARSKNINSNNNIDSVLFAAYTCINCSRTGVHKTVSELFYCKFCEAHYNKNKFIKHRVSVDHIS